MRSIDLTVAELEYAYRAERDPDVKERVFLVLRLREGASGYSVAKAIHRSEGWVAKWRRRYREKGLKGLRDLPRSGRRKALPDKVEAKIRRLIESRPEGWRASEIQELIYQHGHIRYHAKYLYRLMHRWGLELQTPRRGFVETASPAEKRAFKKGR